MVAEVFDTPGLKSDPVAGTFALWVGPSATTRVRADGASMALLGRALSREGWTPVPDSPAEAEQVAAGLRVHHGGATEVLASWPELVGWARGTRPARDGALHRVADADADVVACLPAARSVGAYSAVKAGESDAGWVWLDALYVGATLPGLVDTVAQWAGTAERRVAASILFQGFTARLASPVLAGVSRGLVLDLDPATTAVQSRLGETLGMRCARPGAWTAEIAVDVVARALLDVHLASMIAAVRRGVGVGAAALG